MSRSKQVTPEQAAESNVVLGVQPHGFRLMRNNSGAYKTQGGGFVNYGLGNISKKHVKVSKSSDEIGFLNVTITPEMVGKTIPIFTAIEVKREDFKFPKVFKEGSPLWAQNNFIESIRRVGGFAMFARTPDEVISYLKTYIEWLKS